MLSYQAVQCCRVGSVAIPLYRWLRDYTVGYGPGLVQESALLVVVF